MDFLDEEKALLRKLLDKANESILRLEEQVKLLEDRVKELLDE